MLLNCLLCRERHFATPLKENKTLCEKNVDLEFVKIGHEQVNTCFFSAGFSEINKRRGSF